MRKPWSIITLLLVLVVLLAACSPHTFSRPYQIHVTANDEISKPAIALDAAGVSHITGETGTNVIYYRTVFGPPSKTLTMTLPGSGANFVQFQPDIAVTDDGTAYMVWFEQQGTPDRIACYQVFPAVEPAGGYQTTCTRVDPGYFAVSDLIVIARGNEVYVIYDRIDADSRVASTWYKSLADPNKAGEINDYAFEYESGWIHDWAVGIDADGYLHVAYIDNNGTGPYPHTRYLTYRSNRSVSPDGRMLQYWYVYSGNEIDIVAGISLAFTTSGSGEHVNIVGVINNSGSDEIKVHRCETDGCTSGSTINVMLPASWAGNASISGVEIAGGGAGYALGFIGSDDPSADHQVYTINAGSSVAGIPFQVSDPDPSLELILHSATVTARPNSQITGEMEVFSWGETDASSVQYYTYDGYDTIKVFDATCTNMVIYGDVAANGSFYAGVWEACGETWHSAWAEQINLPVVTK